jgi:hypothetical protein
LADILAPLVGTTEHHTLNSKDLVDCLKHVHLDENECFVSFDVVSLFTNTPIPRTLDIIRDRLLADKKLKLRTRLTVVDIMTLLEFVLTTTYFSFTGLIFKQKFGTDMGSPVSPLVANLFMEHLEQTAIASAPSECKPRIWKRYVDDVLAVIPQGSTQLLNDHLNTIDDTNSIKFTSEEMVDNKIPFLDALITRQEDGTVKTSVYRKATHTNQYLNFHSNHPIVHKLGVVRTLFERCNTVGTAKEDQNEKTQTITKALGNCGYPKWTFNKVK